MDAASETSAYVTFAVEFVKSKYAPTEAMPTSRR
jgi:hypothetical protein